MDFGMSRGTRPPDSRACSTCGITAIQSTSRSGHCPVTETCDAAAHASLDSVCEPLRPAIAKGVGLRDTVLGLCGLAWEARILAGTGAAVAFGNDRNRLAAELGRARANGCKGILSFGTAAGLAPELLAGDLIL